MALLPSGLAKTGVVPFQIYPKTISQSLRFEDGDNPKLEWSNSNKGTPTDSNKFTFSGWVKRGEISASVGRMILGSGTGTNNDTIYFWTDDTLRFEGRRGGTTVHSIRTVAVFRDPSAWYHIVVSYDADQDIGSNRFTIYVNGVEQTLTTSNEVDSGRASELSESDRNVKVGTGQYGSSGQTQYFDGYMAELHFVDGQALQPTEFGELRSGIWVPKEVDVTHGNNGWHLDFADSADLGNNALTTNGDNDFDTVSGLVASDVVPDSPTNNFAVLNNIAVAGNFSEGNLKHHSATSVYRNALSTLGVSSGKWYAEFYVNQRTYETRVMTGVALVDKHSYTTQLGGDDYSWGLLYSYTNSVIYKIHNGVDTPLTSTGDLNVGDVVMVALDLDNNKLWFGENGTWLDSGDPAGNSNEIFTIDSGTYVIGTANYDEGIQTANFGQDSTFAGLKTAGGNTDANGIGDFQYAPPSGFLALCTSNLPDPVIDPAEEATADQHFNVYTYTGNGASQLIGDVVREIPDTYPISQSLRFEDGDNAYLLRTPSSTSSTTTLTVSLWAKLGNVSSGRNNYPQVWGVGNNSGRRSGLRIDDGALDGQLVVFSRPDGDGSYHYWKANVFIKDSDWHHYVLKIKTDAVAQDDQVRLWLDGLEVTSWEAQGTFNSSYTDIMTASGTHVPHAIGSDAWSPTSYEWDGYIAEVHYCDGQEYEASDFGVYDADGLWRPIEPTVTYGTAGYHLDFADSADIGDDNSGNTNDFTTVNGLVATDVVIDTPTNQFAVLNSLDKEGNHSVYQGNTWFKVSSGDSNWGSVRATLGVTKGKWYWEEFNTFTSAGTDEENIIFGMMRKDQNINNYIGGTSTNPVSGAAGIQFVGSNSNAVVRAGYGTYATYSQNLSPDDVVNIAYDADAGKVWFGVNGTYLNSGDPAAGTGASIEGVICDADNPMFPAISAYRNYLWGAINCGQDSTFSGELSPASNADENGYGEFQNAPPSGFLAVCENNLIQYDDNPLESPDLVWLKRRNSTGHNGLWDSIRGEGSALLTNSTNAANTNDAGYDLTGFSKNGFTVGPDNVGTFNTSGSTFVGWAWKAGGTAVSNTDGSITSTVSANTDAGFSIASWTATTGTKTVGHGLDSTPEMVIMKNLSATSNWAVFHTVTGSHQLSYLNLTNAAITPAETGPTSTVFTVGQTSATTGSSGNSMIAYCFHSVDGFSKVGSYEGNNSTDGTFVYTGFRPKWVLIKHADSTGNWTIFDAERSTYNLVDDQLLANLSNAEKVQAGVDFLSNGFKLRVSGVADFNNTDTYIYLAFAEQPFKYSNAR